MQYGKRQKRIPIDKTLKMGKTSLKHPILEKQDP